MNEILNPSWLGAQGDINRFATESLDIAHGEVKLSERAQQVLSEIKSRANISRGVSNEALSGKSNSLHDH